MKKVFLLHLLALLVLTISCQNNTAKDNTASESTDSNTATILKKEVKGMSADEARQKFGIDFEKEVSYKGFYHYYLNAAQKEVLQGQFILSTSEDREAYVLKKSGPKATHDDFDAAMLTYVDAKYTGQFQDGVKDGKFTFDGSYFEADIHSSIVFDVQTAKCVEATLKGTSGGSCMEYQGPISTCSFEEVFKLRSEKLCD